MNIKTTGVGLWKSRPCVLNIKLAPSLSVLSLNNFVTESPALNIHGKLGMFLTSLEAIADCILHNVGENDCMYTAEL